MCPQRDVTRKTGTEAQVGLLDVRPGRQRIHFATGDAGNCHGKLNCTLLRTLSCFQRSGTSSVLSRYAISTTPT